MSSFEYPILFLGLIFRLGAFSSFGETYPVYYFSKLIIYALTLIAAFFFFFVRFSLFLKIIRSHIPFFLFVIFAGLSLTWNENLQFGITDYIRNLDLIFYSIFLIYRFEEKEVFNFLRKSLVFILIASFILFLIKPNLALWGNEIGAESGTLRFGFRGIMSTKGMMAIVCNLLILIFFSKPNLFKPSPIKSAVYILSLFITLFLCGSVTSVFGLAFVCLGVFLLKNSSKNKLRTFIFVTPIFAILIGFFYLNYLFGFLDEFFGRDFTSFSGRTEIWEYGLDKIKDRLFFGFGVNGYCLGSLSGEKCNFSQLSDLTNSLELSAKVVGLNPHNEFLSILLNYGIVGFLIFASIFVKLYFRVFKLHKYNKGDWFNNFYLYFLIYSPTLQFFAGYFFSPLNTAWFPFLIIYFLVYHPRNDLVFNETVQGI